MLEVLATTIQETKKKSRRKRSKTVTVWRWHDDTENPKDATRKLLQLLNESGKVAGYKINTQKSLAFLHTNNERLEREIKEIIPFTITSKRINLGLNLPRKAKDLYFENCKTLKKETEDDTNESYALFLDWKNQYCQNDHTAQGNLQIQCSFSQISNGIFHKTKTKVFFTFIRKHKTPQ